MNFSIEMLEDLSEEEKKLFISMFYLVTFLEENRSESNFMIYALTSAKGLLDGLFAKNGYDRLLKCLSEDIRNPLYLKRMEEIYNLVKSSSSFIVG